MSSPSSSSSTSQLGQSSSLNINALISGDKWGGATGTGVTLTYSFPWTSATTAIYSSPTGTGSYTTLNEPNATSHYGLNTTQQEAARNAVQSWANVANIVFSEVAETSSNVGDIRLAWTSANQTAWGWAYGPNDYWPSGGDIWISTLNTNAATNSWANGSYNFEALIHELGHALGLKHSFEEAPILPSEQESRQYTVMSYTDHPHNLFRYVTASTNGTYSFSYVSIEPDSPMLYDMAAIQYMYGANLSYKTGNDVYTFDPNTPFIRTLWDAAGTDTISVSNFTKGCTIDLQQGRFSKITIESDSLPPGYTGGSVPTYDGTDNLAIALGCIIENAIGGSGNDTLIGNDSNNNLEGGAGNDTVSGGGGANDICTFSDIFANYTYSYDLNNNTFTFSCTATGTDLVSGVEFFQFQDITKSASQLQGGDITPPILSSLSPSDNATGVAVSANLVLTFNENVKAGSGNFIIFNANGTVAKTIAVTDTSQVSISGSSVTLNPGTDLAAGSGYYLNAAAGVLKDLADNSFAGLAGTTVYNFTTANNAISPVSLQTILARNYGALYGIKVGYAHMASDIVQAGTNPDAFLNKLYINSIGVSETSTVAVTLVKNLGITNPALAAIEQDNFIAQLDAVPAASRGAVVNAILSQFSGLAADLNFFSYATAWNTKVANAVAYAAVFGNPDTAFDSSFTRGNTITGTAGNDILSGTSASDFIDGLAGHDALYGKDGNDMLNGGAGYDYLVGGKGNDTLDGGADIDAVDYYYYDTTGPVTVNLQQGTASGAGIGTDTLISIETVYGSYYDDALIGNDNTNYLCGIDGNDKLDGRGGDDSLWGWIGNDKLYGGKGNDLLYGGAGADTFYFESNSGVDTINDFSKSEDKIAIVSGTNGITTPAQAVSHLSTNAAGAAVLDLGQGNTVTLIGVSAASLNSNMFMIVQ